MVRVPYADLEELACDCAKAIVETHPDVLLTCDMRWRDREFAEEALAEVILRTVLAKGLGKA